MRDEPVNPQHFVDTQADVFRVAKRDHGLSVARLSAKSGIPETTIASWSKGTAMPAWAFVELSRHIPAACLNLLMEGTGNVVAAAETDASGLDELGCEASGFTHELMEARRDGKVTHIEAAKLREKARKVAAAAQAVASAK